MLNKEKIENQKKKYEEKLQKAKIKKNFKDQIKSIRFDTFTKAMVALIIIVAIIDLQLSYILAFFDKIQIAEELSKQVCTTILGVAFVYMIRAYFDSKAEYSNKYKNELDDSIKTMEDKIIDESGNTIYSNTKIIEESTTEEVEEESIEG